jgi:polysaccharide biosynthesis/export protein
MIKYIRLLLSVIGGVLIITSCSPVLKTPAALDERQVSSVPAKTYQIEVGDSLDIKFFYMPELNESVVVRPDGRISLQLVQDIQASGLTPEQLKERLYEKYRAQINQPEITVLVRSFNAQKIYVDGEVNKPGLVPLTGQMTLLQSLASAGGLKDTARSEEIILIRRGPENRPISRVINIEKVVDGTEPTQDLLLLPADIVFVPKSPVANVNLWIDQYIRKNIPIPFGFSYGVTP